MLRRNAQLLYAASDPARRRKRRRGKIEWRGALRRDKATYVYAKSHIPLGGGNDGAARANGEVLCAGTNCAKDATAYAAPYPARRGKRRRGKSEWRDGFRRGEAQRCSHSGAMANLCNEASGVKPAVRRRRRDAVFSAPSKHPAQTGRQAPQARRRFLRTFKTARPERRSAAPAR